MGNEVKVTPFSLGEAPAQANDQGRQQASLPGRYEPSRQPRWISFGLIALIHTAAFIALRYIGPDILRSTPTAPLVVNLLQLQPPPPDPQPITLPTEQKTAPMPIPQQVVAPSPIVKVSPAPVVVATVPRPEPAPPTPVKVEEAAPAAPHSAETMVNLNTRLISADPPRYPVEARRRHETGTVVLLVVVDEQGKVSAISVTTSSGVDRLDKAALAAVRRWRWSPTIINGLASQVKGLVRIPFELKVL